MKEVCEKIPDIEEGGEDASKFQVSNTEILDESVVKFLKFFEEEILKPKPLSNLSKAVGWTGAGMGVSSALISYPYGYDFGRRITQTIGNPVIDKISGHWFGLSATLAMGALSARITKIVWQEFCKRDSKAAKDLRSKGFRWTDFTQYTHLGVTAILGAVSSGPTVYLCHEYFSKYLEKGALVLDIPTFLALTTVRAWALQALDQMLYDAAKNKIVGVIVSKQERLTVLGMRHGLMTCLQESKKDLAHLSKHDLDSFYNEIFGNSDSSAQLLDRAYSLMHPSLKYQRTAISNEMLQQCVGHLGRIIGSLSVYSLDYFGALAGKSILNVIGIEDPDFREFFSKFMGAASYICVGALAIKATGETFEKLTSLTLNLFSRFYRRLKGSHAQDSVQHPKFDVNDLKLLSMRLLTLSLLGIGLSSSSPRADLVIIALQKQHRISTFYGPIFIACAILSTFLVDFWALDSVAKEALTGDVKAKRMMGALDQLKKLFSQMDDAHVVQLYNTLMRGCEAGNLQYPLSLDATSIPDRSEYQVISEASEDEIQTKRTLSEDGDSTVNDAAETSYIQNGPFLPLYRSTEPASPRKIPMDQDRAIVSRSSPWGRWKCELY